MRPQNGDECITGRAPQKNNRKNKQTRSKQKLKLKPTDHTAGCVVEVNDPQLMVSNGIDRRCDHVGLALHTCYT